MKANKYLFKRSTKTAAMLLTIAIGAVSLFQNCANPQFEQSIEPSLTSTGDPDRDTEIVKKVCQRQNLVTKLQKINFPNPSSGGGSRSACGWGQNGNLGSEALEQSDSGYEARFTARAEQTVELNIPDNAVICDLDFQFPTQDFLYDDHMFFLFDNVVLASTSAISPFLSETNGMQIYDWSKLVSQKWTDSRYVYCLGADANESTCTWPKTQTRGSIGMDFSPKVLMNVVGLNLSRPRHSFRMVTTGDNNPDIDCSHQDISFDVNISYTVL